MRNGSKRVALGLMMACFVQIANSHAMLRIPKPIGKSAQGGDNWYNQGTTIGCKSPTSKWCTPTVPCCEEGVGTLKEEYMTYPKYGPTPGFNQTEADQLVKNLYGPILPATPYSTNLFVQNPWFAPGHAPVASPCGILGATTSYGGLYDKYDMQRLAWRLSPNHHVSEPNISSGLAFGVDGVVVLAGDYMKVNDTYFDPKGNPDVIHTVWTSGSTAEVGFQMMANHGGGYQYRICKMDKLMKNTGHFNEECFQETPLEFAGSSTELRSGDFSISTPRVEVTDGVTPKGSAWAQNPLPACAGAGGGRGKRGICNESQFENNFSRAGIFGWSADNYQNSEKFTKLVDDYMIVDRVKVPKGLEGFYAVSFRWDCEQTPQIWTICSLVNIKKGESFGAEGLQYV